MMWDFFRFIVAVYTVIISIHLASFVFTFLLMAILSIPMVIIKSDNFNSFVMAIGYLFRYYIAAAILQIMLSNWIPEYPEYKTAFIFTTITIASAWILETIVFKTNELKAAWRDFSEGKPDSFEVLKVHKSNYKWIMFAACTGLVLVLFGFVDQSIFQNKLVNAIMNGYNILLEVPVLPMILGIFGIIWALSGGYKILSVIGSWVVIAVDRIRGI